MSPSVGPLSSETSSPEQELPSMVATLMQTRQTILPRHLVAPGPDEKSLQTILGSAACAPDHGRLLPWRLIMVPASERSRLGEVFGDALMERDPSATPQQVEQARNKAFRSPCLLLVTVDSQCGDLQIDLMERIVAAGCAVQNMLLMATALGYGSALTSGKALKSAPLRKLFGLQASEHALCFISLGTVTKRKSPSLRPQINDYVRTL